MKKRPDDGSSLTFHAAEEGRWEDLAELFGARGACGGCWCMAWRLPRSEFVGGKGGKNRRRLRKLVTSGDAPGVLAYAGGQAVGWCAVAPRQVYSFLSRSRVLREVDDRRVWSISCLFVRQTHRRQGVSTRLLRAAVDFAAARGAEAVEGYPVVPYSPDAPGAFLWTGTYSSFVKAGFKEVARRSPSRPIMRARAKA